MKAELRLVSIIFLYVFVSLFLLRASSNLEDFISIRIPRALYDDLQRRVKASRDEFKTVEEYIEYILGEVVKPEPESTLSEEDEEEIKENLKRLGYL